MNYQKELEEIRGYAKEAKRIAFLGGAGVSTASGISDFRSPKGLYNVQSKYGHGYETMLSHSFFLSHPEEFYSFYWESMVNEAAKPNSAHLALASFEERHPHKLTVITQNIDGLHQKAGSKVIYELHGSVANYFCLDCGKKYRLAEIPHHGLPHCSCGGLLKPDVVLYEEPLDEDVLFSSINAIRMANLLLCAGTSLRVEPSASLPSFFSFGKSVLINAEPTPCDERFDYVLRMDVGEALKTILGD